MLRRQVLAAGSAAIVGACASHRISTTAPSQTRFDWSLAPAAAGGMIQSGIDAMRAGIQSKIDSNEIRGAVSAVVRHNRLVWFEAQGYRDPAGDPIRHDDLFRLMSSTKMVTAVAIMMMAETGALSIEDAVSRFIPSFAHPRVALALEGATERSQVQVVPADREITIKDLLTHTSGLTMVGDPEQPAPGPSRFVNADIQKGPDDTLADWVERLGGAALDAQPGARFQYSPFDGFDILLRIVEITSGQPADVFMRERLFEPLDMRETYFFVPPDKQARVLNPLQRTNAEWRAAPPIFRPSPRYTSGGAGLCGTVRDHMNFQLALLNGGSFNGRRILRPETVALMRRNHAGDKFAQYLPPLTGGWGFGLGGRILEDPSRGGGRGVGAFGWPGAYGTEAWIDPELDLAAVWFVQLFPTQFSQALDFSRMVRSAIVG